MERKNFYDKTSKLVKDKYDELTEEQKEKIHQFTLEIKNIASATENTTPSFLEYSVEDTTVSYRRGYASFD